MKGSPLKCFAGFKQCITSENRALTTTHSLVKINSQTYVNKRTHKVLTESRASRTPEKLDLAVIRASCQPSLKLMLTSFPTAFEVTSLALDVHPFVPIVTESMLLN